MNIPPTPLGKGGEGGMRSALREAIAHNEKHRRGKIHQPQPCPKPEGEVIYLNLGGE